MLSFFLQLPAPIRMQRKEYDPSGEEVNASRGFVEKLESRQINVNSLLCVGLDPVIENIPQFLKEEVVWMPPLGYYEGRTVQDFILEKLLPENPRDARMYLDSRIEEEFCKKIIRETHQFASAYKPNMGFWERYAEFGVAATRRVIKFIKQVDQEIPVILDAKRADIGATNKGYADMVDGMGADAVTVNPYFGLEGENALDPFLGMKNTGIIVLCRTSNPEASEMQDVIVKDDKLGEVPYYIKVAYMAEEARKNVNPNVSIVVGATVPEQLKKARQVFNGVILVPALGKQGGKPEDLRNAFDHNRRGIIANNSSGIIHASKKEDFAEVAKEKAREWRDMINEVRQAA